LIINPGECCGWLTNRATIAVLDLSTMSARLIEL
jgi:predicted phosphodiesterase